jgi:hypothetical protein
VFCFHLWFISPTSDPISINWIFPESLIFFWFFGYFTSPDPLPDLVISCFGLSFLVWVGDWRFWSNPITNFNANYNAKSNFHAMLHPSLGGSVLFLEHFTTLDYFLWHVTKTSQISGGAALSQPVTKNLAHSTVLFSSSISTVVVLYLFHFPSIPVLLRKRQFSAQFTWCSNPSSLQ